MVASGSSVTQDEIGALLRSLRESILVQDTVQVAGSFVPHYFAQALLAPSAGSQGRVCFVTTEVQSADICRVARKLGVPGEVIASRLRVVEVQHVQPDADAMANLVARIQAAVAELSQDQLHPTGDVLLIFDCLSTLGYCVPEASNDQLMTRLVWQLRALPGISASVFVAHWDTDGHRSWARLLRQSASCTISVEPLETGHTRDVTGLMVIQRQREGAERGDATPLKRRLFFLVGQAAVKFMERPSL